jgi:hypothetical protein
MKERVRIHTPAKHIRGGLRGLGWRGRDGQVLAWGAIRLNHEGVAGVMRLTHQGVVWLWCLRRIVAVHMSSRLFLVTARSKLWAKSCCRAEPAIGPEPQLMSQLRCGRLKRPKTAVFKNLAAGQRAYPMPARMRFFNACCHFSTTFERPMSARRN